MTHRFDTDQVKTEYRTIRVLRFLDTREDARWFQRRHEDIGGVSNVRYCDGTLQDAPGLLAYVRANFGPDAWALY